MQDRVSDSSSQLQINKKIRKEFEKDHSPALCPGGAKRRVTEPIAEVVITSSQILEVLCNGIAAEATLTGIKGMGQ